MWSMTMKVCLSSCDCGCTSHIKGWEPTVLGSLHDLKVQLRLSWFWCPLAFVLSNLFHHMYHQICWFFKKHVLFCTVFWEGVWAVQTGSRASRQVIESYPNSATTVGGKHVVSQRCAWRFNKSQNTLSWAQNKLLSTSTDFVIKEFSVPRDRMPCCL